MKVLILCESSGVMREAFRSAGHDAWSNDLLPADTPTDYHIQGDCIDVLKSNERWDLIIMHPECTALCVSGNAHYGTGMAKHDLRLAAIDWTMKLWHLATTVCDKVCMENPVGVLPIKPTQYVQPYQFGHAESKKTGLWLHGLQPLTPTNIIDKPERGYWDNQTPSGQNNLGPSENRWKQRSRTYEGIAAACAEQWGSTSTPTPTSIPTPKSSIK